MAKITRNHDRKLRYAAMAAEKDTNRQIAAKGESRALFSYVE